MVLPCPSEVTPKILEVLCQSWSTLCLYSFSLPSTMTTTGSLFFSCHLHGLCDRGAYVFSSDNRNSRRELEEVASAAAWITEVYRGRANRGRHLPSEKLKIVCRKVDPCHKSRPSVSVYLPSMSSLWICDHLWMDEFVETGVRLHFNHAWLLLCWCVHGSPHSLWKRVSDYTSTMPDYCSANVFTGRHIVCGNGCQITLQPCLIIALLMCSWVAT